MGAHKWEVIEIKYDNDILVSVNFMEHRNTIGFYILKQVVWKLHL